MIQARAGLSPASLLPKLHRVFELSAAKLRSIERTWSPSQGSPVCTVQGRYATRGWTEWTQGFQFGSAILQFDATGETEFLEIGRERTVSLMAPHLTHTGVHDHGFNNVSTYGNLLRLIHEGRVPDNPWERRFYELALKCSGAVQAGRWSHIAEGGGFIYSFNGPHSLFVDTIRSARSLVLAHRLGHVLLGENDRRISLLDRGIEHAWPPRGIPSITARAATLSTSAAAWRTSAFSTPTTATSAAPARSRATRPSPPGRAAWLGPCSVSPNSWNFWIPWQSRPTPFGRWSAPPAPPAISISPTRLPTASPTGTPAPPAWKEPATGAPFPPIHIMPPSPSTAPPPSSPRRDCCAWAAAWATTAIGRQASRFATLSSTRPTSAPIPGIRGCYLHSVYHRPNGWNWQPGESSMWGDYHARELALYLLRLAEGGPYLKFWL